MTLECIFKEGWLADTFSKFEYSRGVTILETAEKINNCSILRKVKGYDLIARDHHHYHQIDTLIKHCL